jgi:hypothetical protein
MRWSAASAPAGRMRDIRWWAGNTRAGQEEGMEQLQPVVVIIIGLVLLAVAWKVITGILRLVLTVVVIGAVIYFLLPVFAR